MCPMESDYCCKKERIVKDIPKIAYIFVNGNVCLTSRCLK